MKIGVIVAMDKEYAQLEAVANTIEKHEIVLQKCGIGKVNAAVGAVQMIRDHHPDVIISSGCAGGNGDNLHVQDVVVSTETVYHDVYCGNAIGGSVYGQVQGMPARFSTPSTLVNKAMGLPKEEVGGLRIVPGLIVTGDWFVDTQEKMRAIIDHFPDARAVDMESAAIAQTCHIFNVPFVSFRVISDMPLSDEHASQYHNFWTTVADKSFGITRSFIEAL